MSWAPLTVGEVEEVRVAAQGWTDDRIRGHVRQAAAPHTNPLLPDRPMTAVRGHTTPRAETVGWPGCLELTVQRCEHCLRLQAGELSSRRERLRRRRADVGNVYAAQPRYNDRLAGVPKYSSFTVSGAENLSDGNGPSRGTLEA